MFRLINRSTLVGAWVAVLAAAAFVAVLAGASITVSASALWLVACVAPPAVMLRVWRGAPPPTMAEILHEVDRRD